MSPTCVDSCTLVHICVYTLRSHRASPVLPLLNATITSLPCYTVHTAASYFTEFSRTMQASLIPGDPWFSFMHFPLNSEPIKLASQQLTPSKLGERKKARLAFLFPVSFFRGKGLKNFPDLLQSYLHNTFYEELNKTQHMSYGPPSLPEGRGFIFSYWGQELNTFHKNQTSWDLGWTEPNGK